MDLDKNQYSVYYINYHLVMVVKYCRKAINNELSAYLKAVFKRIALSVA